MKFSLISFLLILFTGSLLALGVLDVVGTFKVSHYLEFLVFSKFFDIPAILIIFGGVFTNALIISTPADVKEVILMFRKIFSQSKINEHSLLKDVNQMTIWVEEYRRNRVDFINKIQQESKDDFVKYIFTLMSTNYSLNDLKEIAETQIHYRIVEAKKLSDILKNMGNSGPAFGMFGTLFGLVFMLSSLDNPSAVGPGLALGLLATLYGVASTHLLFYPLSKKVLALAEVQQKRDEMILECAMMIVGEKSSLFIKDKLLSHLNLKYVTNPAIFDEETSEEVTIESEETEEEIVSTEQPKDEEVQ